MKVLDLINSSLRLIGALASGETPTADEANDAFSALNQMLDSWSTEELFVYTIPRYEFTPVTLKQTYTLGTGGDINQPRPPRVENIGVIALNNPAQELELPMEKLTQEEWAGIPVKSVQSNLPMKFWNDDAFPLMNINLWPIPLVQIKLALYWWQQLTQFQTLVDNVSFPPGYARALRFGLAVEIAPEYGAPPDQRTMLIAMEAKAAIKSLNIKPAIMRCDPELSGGKGVYDWRTDGPLMHR